MGEYKQANNLYRQALKINRSSKLAFNNLAASMGNILKKEYDQAGKSFEKALQVFQAYKDKRGISELLILMGNLSMAEKKYQQAIRYYEKGQKIALDIELYEDVIKNYFALSQAYETLQNPEKSLMYYKLYNRYKDQVFDEEKHYQISQLNAKHESAQKEQKIKQQEVELQSKQAIIERQNIQRIAFLIIFPCFC